jgi:aminoglycoside phosphotransferase (APT) family kinase protein
MRLRTARGVDLNLQSKIFKALSLEEIRDIAKRHFEDDPQLEATLLKGGLFNTTYKLTLPSAKRELILRLGPVNREYLMPFEHRLMEAECHVYEKLSERQIPCPVVVAVDFSKAYIDRDYMITEFIDSMPLSDEAVPDAAKGSLYEESGKWTAQLHQITGTSFGRVSDILRGCGCDNWGTYLAAINDPGK